MANQLNLFPVEEWAMDAVDAIRDHTGPMDIFPASPEPYQRLYCLLLRIAVLQPMAILHAAESLVPNISGHGVRKAAGK